VTAIRNVGELASPYYLLEVWARREQIDIDPETYASLKQTARRLVRDARAFESRGLEPDEQWRDIRLALFGLQNPSLAGTQLEADLPFDLRIWSDDGGREALLVGSMADGRSPDERPPGAPDPPATRFELALDDYAGEADWGLLLAGLEARVYRRSSGISQQYLAIDLDALVEVDDEPVWKAFAGIFRAPAFSPGPDGVPLIRRVVDESRRHAAALAADMRADVVEAAEAIIQGVLDDRANRARVAEPGRRELQQLFEESLYYLYRILFVLYAEARDVLPLSGGASYATTYSIDHLVERARVEPAAAEGHYYSDTLCGLFALLWAGPDEATEQLGFAPVGGELFDPAHTALLDACAISDVAWRRALQSIALGAPGSARRRLGRRSSFAELGVDQLGSIYEGLLVLEPVVAPGPRVIVREGSDRRVLERHLAAGLRIDREIEEGEFVLESASGRRKGSGSFYTPVEITEYLTNAALATLVEPIVESARLEPGGAVRELLALKVCDPAMGSGAFLVQAARTLGLALARIRAQATDGRVTPEMVAAAKREVVRRCLYGVDLNPLAVALAKVSLWLETLQTGRPLTFLDAHLRVGDSLVGLELRGADGRPDAAELMEWPRDATKGLATYLRKESSPIGQALLPRLTGRGRGTRNPGQLTLGAAGIDRAFAELAERRDSLAASVDGEETRQLELEVARSFREIEDEAASLRNRLRAAADFWCAQWFNDGEDGPPDGGSRVVPATEFQYQEVVGALLAGGAVAPQLAPQVEAARAIARERHFFHWSLEFPEVMVERGGFDAVIGNPPWNTLSPDVKEFFGTFDPHVFRKGVPKERQQERKTELRLDPEIDGAWRREARYLHELSAYAKPDSGRFRWFAPDPQLRKGDANVFRLFVERAYGLLRHGGRLAQVLPDSFYVSSPATGLRQQLLTGGVLDRCFVFENRRKIFPIDSRIKVALVVVERGGGPTDRFRAAFLVGKDAAGRERTVGLDELPDTLADLDREAPELSLEQLRLLSPTTWAFPELQTVLDAEIAAHCATHVPPLNLDDRGWGLRYSRGLHANEDDWRFKTQGDLVAIGCRRDGIRWIGPRGESWWPLVEGQTFYHLEFPAEGSEPRYWVNGDEVRAIEKFLDETGQSHFEQYRVAWRDTASATNERSAIAAVIPPRSAEKHTAPSVLAGALDARRLVGLAAAISSFVFDYLVRFGGKTHLTHYVLDAVPTPLATQLDAIVDQAAEVVCRTDEFEQLWARLCPGRSRSHLDGWHLGERRAIVDAGVALAYGLDIRQFAALLSTFPNLDRTQPMLPGEPKSFVTRDVALVAFCLRADIDPPDVDELLRSVGVRLPAPRDDLRRLDVRVERYRQLGAIPYRPTPRGGRTPDDPELVAAIRELLDTRAQTAGDLAELLDQDEAVVAQIAERLVREDPEVYVEGRGARRRYYLVEEE
jgi:hypothetical protein